MVNSEVTIVEDEEALDKPSSGRAVVIGHLTWLPGQWSLVIGHGCQSSGHWSSDMVARAVVIGHLTWLPGQWSLVI
ncbi:hypothetical protein RRG08_065033 [Elysia crispata]|uniref:Uncharacterized protein n=1 Tax=Elysia crispata TaxID=231223 RepID=A0AAE0Y1T6_9GAST|nr:hypothetical protein RRG08_065033 [Elysia crispata]